MKQIICCLITLCCVLFILDAPRVEAGTAGKVATLLARNYCASPQTAKGYGCWGYFYYRIDKDKKRSGAMSECKWNCGRVKPEQKSDCDAGCAVALDIEKD